MSPRLKLKRFKVKPPAPEILTHYVRVYSGKELYFIPEHLPPITARELFHNDHPLVFDLGCGRGDFLIAEARRSPERNFIGVEIHWKSVWDAVNKAHAAGLENIRVVRADAGRVLVKVPDQTAVEVFLLFPPPLKEDFFDALLLREIQRILVEGGTFHFATDHADYFQRRCTWIERSSLFETVAIFRGFEGGITDFQRRWEGYGIATQRAEYRKRSVP